QLRGCTTCRCERYPYSESAAVSRIFDWQLQSGRRPPAQHHAKYPSEAASAVSPLLCAVPPRCSRSFIRVPKVQAPVDQHFVQLCEELNRNFEIIGLAAAWETRKTSTSCCRSCFDWRLSVSHSAQRVLLKGSASRFSPL